MLRHWGLTAAAFFSLAPFIAFSENKNQDSCFISNVKTALDAQPKPTIGFGLKFELAEESGAYGWLNKVRLGTIKAREFFNHYLRPLAGSRSESATSIDFGNGFVLKVDAKAKLAIAILDGHIVGRLGTGGFDRTLSIFQNSPENFFTALSKLTVMRQWSPQSADLNFRTTDLLAGHRKHYKDLYISENDDAKYLRYARQRLQMPLMSGFVLSTPKISEPKLNRIIIVDLEARELLGLSINTATGESYFTTFYYVEDQFDAFSVITSTMGISNLGE